jgi:hypothetical protein
MLRRLMAWCVPANALELRAPKFDVTDVEQVLEPYVTETPAPVPDTVRHLPRSVPAS